jgi:quinone-modifying oxidoreductase, subunit QmoC
MHYLQMGLEKPLRSALDPWLCYYCGECSEQCPRGAEPGETMMGMRRWLTAQYDFTGISRFLYRSWASELIGDADAGAAHRHRIPRLRISLRRRQPLGL